MTLGFLAASAIASFTMVALRAFQQLNVILDKKKWVVPTSLGMALAEAIVVINTVSVGIHPAQIGAVGLGAGLGCLTAMKVHRRMRG